MKYFSKISFAVISGMLLSISVRAESAKDMNVSQLEKHAEAKVFQISNQSVYKVKSLQADRAANNSVCKWNMENFNPDIFPLHKLDTKAESYDSDKLANLAIKNEVGTILIYPTEGVSAFKDLTSTSVTKLFGEPAFRGQSEREPSLDLLIFHLKAIGPSNEPNIFHLEIETAKSGQIKNYRVRGYGIKNTEWLSI